MPSVLRPETETMIIAGAPFGPSLVTRDQLLEAQRSEAAVRKLRICWEKDWHKELTRGAYFDEQGLLFLNTREVGSEPVFRLYLPASLREKIVTAFHDTPVAAHPGWRKTLALVQERFTWGDVRKTVREHVLRCQYCLFRKVIATKLPTTTTIGRLSAFQLLSIDILGPIDVDIEGYRYILTGICHQSHWPFGIALANGKADTVLRALIREVWQYNGWPIEIQMDNASNFAEQGELQQQLEQMGVTFKRIPTYSGASNSRVERQHAGVKNALQELCAQYHGWWGSMLPYVMFALRAQRHEETGVSPFFMLFGREPSFPQDNMFKQIHPDAMRPLDHYEAKTQANRVLAAKELVERVFSKGPEYRPLFSEKVSDIRVGDLVVYRGFQAGALDERYGAVGKVVDIQNGVTCIVEDVETRKRNLRHLRQIKRYYPPNTGLNGVQLIVPIAASILQERTHKGKLQYRVKFLGQGKCRAQWHDATLLQQTHKRLVQHYTEEKGVSQKVRAEKVDKPGSQVFQVQSGTFLNESDGTRTLTASVHARSQERGRGNR